MTSNQDSKARTYTITTLDEKPVITITVIGRGEQVVCNALVELGYNPLLYTWKQI